jgi:ATP-dependent Clp protease ATP-binding subunit ClpC
MDRLEMAADTASSLRSRLVRRRSGAGQGARELVGRLALQCHLLHEGLRDLDEASPVEVALAVEPAFESSTGDRQAGAEWSRRIAAMYRGWARERNMQMVELEGGAGQGPVGIYSGFGAFRRLTREAGLHVLEGGENGAGRAAARVLAVPVPPREMPRQRLRALLAEAFAALPRTGTVVRRYRLGASPLVRNAEGTWRSGKVDAVLAGNFDLLATDT